MASFIRNLLRKNLVLSLLTGLAAGVANGQSFSLFYSFNPNGTNGDYPEWRLNKITSFSGICCGAAFLSLGDGDDLVFDKA